LPRLGKQLDDFGPHILVVQHKQLATGVEADELRADSPLAWHSWPPVLLPHARARALAGVSFRVRSDHQRNAPHRPSTQPMLDGGSHLDWQWPGSLNVKPQLNHAAQHG